MPCVRLYFRAVVVALATTGPKIWERAAKNASLLLGRGLKANHLRSLAQAILSAIARCKNTEHKCKKSLLYIFRQCNRLSPEGVGDALAEAFKRCNEEDERTRLLEVLRPAVLQEMPKAHAKVWESLAEIAGVTLQHRIVKQGENCASLADESSKLEERISKDPTTITCYNVNGLKARWGKGIPTTTPDTSNDKSTRNLPFPDVVKRLNTPDVIFVLESKITLSNLLKLPNFQTWRKDSGYRYLSCTWSGELKGKKQEGYAGVSMFSKTKPQKVIFGFGNKDLDGEREGRIITAIFPTMVLIGEYSPCSGWAQMKVDKKIDFERKVKLHIQYLKKNFPKKTIIRAGDLNVNPRDCDCSQEAAEHWRKHTRSDERREVKSGPVPGCRPEEVKAYEETCESYGGVNVWEELYPAKTNFHTWAHPHDRFGKKGFGQRIDHFVVGKELIDGTHGLQVRDMKVHMGLGTSDHWPITLWLGPKIISKEAQKSQAILLLQKKGVYSEKWKEWSWEKPITGRIYKINKVGSPVIKMHIGSDDSRSEMQQCFVDTGSPITIFNPDPGTKPEDDKIFGKYFRELPATIGSCVLQGVGGAQIEARLSFTVPFLMGGRKVETSVMCLEKHESTLPKLLLGYQSVMHDFGGMNMIPKKNGGLKISFKKGEPEWFQGEGVTDEAEGKVATDAISLSEPQMRKAASVLKLTEAENRRRDDGKEERRGDALDELTSEISQGCFVEGLAPEIGARLEWDKESERCSAVIDGSSCHNFISEEYIESLRKRCPKVERLEAYFEIVGPTGEVVEVKKKISCRLVVGKEKLEVILYVLPSIPTDISIGAATQKLLNSKVDKPRKKWIINYNEKQAVEMDIGGWVCWRTAMPLRALKDVTIPPRSQSKLSLQRISDSSLDVFEGKTKIIAPISQTFSSRVYKVAWGPCLEPTWAQMANPTNEPLFVRKGEHIAELHLGGGWETESVDLNPSIEEQAEEVFKDKEVERVQLVRALKILGVRQNNEIISPFEIKSSHCSAFPEWKGAVGDEVVNKHAHKSVDDNVVINHVNNTTSLRIATAGSSRSRPAASDAHEGKNNGSPEVEGSSYPSTATHTSAEKNPASVSNGESGALNNWPASVIKNGGSFKVPDGLDSKHQESKAKVHVSSMSKEEKLATLAKLGIDLQETINCRTREEVDLLIDWCLSRMDSVAKDGKLDFSRDVKHNTKMSIETITENPVFKAYAGRATPDKVKEIQKQTEEKLKQGIIEKSSAPWSSNCVCISKNGKVRIAVDYRKLNEVTVKDNYLLPTIQECLDQLHGTRFFTSIDAAQAYHQIPLATERDKDLTSFVVPGGGLYRYKYMPFGLANAGAVWTRFIDEVLEGLRWNVCLVYADDILVYTKSSDVRDHIRDLDRVFDRLDKYNVKVKGDKMRLALKELPFLGQLVSEEGCRPDPSKTKAITELQAPTSVHQLRRVMGMFAYYRKYINNFADVAAPLYELCGKNAQNKRLSNKSIALSPTQKKCFDKLKRLLTTKPIFLRFADWNAPFEVHCDASNVGIAAVLWQKGSKDEDKGVVMYASRMLTATEQKYHAYEKEALALVWSLDLFRLYLRKRFRVITDCRSLTYLRKNAANTRVARWMLRLQEFDFEIKHRAGALSSDCDGMTRQPLESTSPYGEAAVEPLYGEDTPHRSVFTDETLTTILPITRASKKTQEPEVTEVKGKRKGQEPTEEPRPAKKPTRRAKQDKAEEVAEKPPAALPQAKQPEEEEEEEVPFFKCKKDLQGWDLSTWLQEQLSEENKEVSTIRTYMEKSIAEGKDSKYCYTPDRLLARRKEKEGYRDRIVVPETLKAFVLGQHHNLPLHAHQGRERMLKMIASRYYWPGMQHDVKRWTQSCDSCVRRKTTRKVHAGLTTETLATEPWEVVGIDLVGECLETTNKNKWILTITDHYTRWPIAIPIPDKKADTVAKVLYEHLITEHGTPRKILTDQGKEFVNEGIETLCKRWGIRKVVTGGYNPQANGACERFHRWLNAAMTQLYDRKDPDWDQYLPAIAFAYRVSESDATGYSPFFLNKGREAVLPSDLTFTPQKEEPQEEEGYVDKMLKRLQEAFAMARRRQYKAFVDNRNKEPDRQKPDFKEGDLVMLYSKTAKEARLEIAGDKRSVPTKWRNQWIGPAVFKEEISNTNCNIVINGKTIVANYNRLAKFIPWDVLVESSYEWKERIEGRKPRKKKGNQPETVNLSEGDRLLVGDVFLFEMAGRRDGHQNFGVGMALNVSSSNIHFQWMGNYYDAHTINGSFKLGWIDTTKNVEYYRKTKETKRHEQFTGQATNTVVEKESVLLIGEENILTKDHRLTAKALKMLR